MKFFVHSQLTCFFFCILVASVKGSIHSSQLPLVISQWFPPSDRGNMNDIIDDVLSDLNLANKDELTCDEFIALCDVMNEQVM